MRSLRLSAALAAALAVACASEPSGSDEPREGSPDSGRAGEEAIDEHAEGGPRGEDASVPKDASASRDAGASPRDAGHREDARASGVDGSPSATRDAESDVASPGTPPNAGANGAGAKLPPVSSTGANGPFRSTQELRDGPRGGSGLFWPTELGKDGLKHPVFVWGCGGGSTPSSYAEMLLQVASHGFVVIAEVAEIGDNGAPLKAAIDWIVAENTRDGSRFFGVVDTKKTALGGHSIGSANSFYIADDPRLTTTIHVAGGSLDNVRDPRAPTTGMGGKRLVHPVAYVCSMSDSFGNVEKSEKDYENSSAPAWMTVMTGVNHTGAARSGMPAIIAWLRWHLGGETDRKSAFHDSGGEFTKGIFVSKSKNW